MRCTAQFEKAWDAIDELYVIWKSTLSNNLKRVFLLATGESVLTHGSSSWTLPKQPECCTMPTIYPGRSILLRNVCMAIYLPSQTLSENEEFDLLNIVGEISDTRLGIPSHGHTRVGRPARTFISQQAYDTGCPFGYLPAAMQDRVGGVRL